jgi:hypothetical protein
LKIGLIHERVRERRGNSGPVAVAAPIGLSGRALAME